MAGRHRLYGGLIRLYPRAFRDRYADDLVRHLADLVADRGRAAAWSRTTVDLLVTLPRYRLEHVMDEAHAATTLGAILALLAAVGVLGLLAGLPLAAVPLGAALVLAVARRSSLARAIRTPDTGRRRRRLTTAAVLGVAFATAVASYVRAVSDDEISGLSLVVHNAVGVPAMVGALVFLVMGLLTPRSTPEAPVG